MTGTQPRMPVSEISSAMPPAFHVMTKPRGALCNLGCRYCFYSSKEGLYPGSGFRMSKKLLESYIRQHIEAHRAPEIIFSWQGNQVENGKRTVGQKRWPILYEKLGLTFEDLEAARLADDYSENVIKKALKMLKERGEID